MRMSDYTDEEFNSFVKHNRDLVEKLMTMQKDMTMNALNTGKEFGMGAAQAGMGAAQAGMDAAERARMQAEGAAQVARAQAEGAAEFAKEQTMEAAYAAKEAADFAKQKTEQAAKYAKEQTEDFMKTTYDMFNDPAIQKHFMSMGIEFMSGMSALMQKAPMPDVVKEAAADMEKNWKQTTCRKNDQCAAKRAKAQKVKVDVDPDAEAKADDVPKEIVVTDISKE